MRRGCSATASRGQEKASCVHINEQAITRSDACVKHQRTLNDYCT